MFAIGFLRVAHGAITVYGRFRHGNLQCDRPVRLGISECDLYHNGSAGGKLNLRNR